MTTDEDIPTVEWRSGGEIQPIGMVLYDDREKRWRRHWWQFWRPKQRCWWIPCETREDQ